MAAGLIRISICGRERPITANQRWGKTSGAQRCAVHVFCRRQDTGRVPILKNRPNPKEAKKMSDEPSHDGHDRHAGHSVAMFRDKFWLSLALTIPVVVWSGHVQALLGYSAPSFPGSGLIPPVLGTVIF